MIVDLRALMAVCSLSLPVLRGQSSWSASSSRTLAFTTLQRAQRLTLKQHQQSYANDLVDLDSPPPPTWTELQDIISSGQLEKLKRSLACQRDYDRHKVEIQKEWVSLYDYILYDKFGLERTKDSSGRYCVVPSKQIQISLKENTFPYHVGENVDHWVLWKLGGDCTVDDILDAKQQLSSKLENVQDFLHWVNPPPLQSLPEIDHTHILVLKSDVNTTFL